MAAVEQGIDPGLVRLLDEVVRQVASCADFSSVQREGACVRCISAVQPDAAFELQAVGRDLCIAWVSADRYLSQSIEADLMWTGDDLDELIEEELAANGDVPISLGKVEHFRDENKRFTFRSLLPAGCGADVAARALLAYAAAFANLGDMKAEED